MLILQLAYDPLTRVVSAATGDYAGTTIDNDSVQITVSGIPAGYSARIDFRVSVTDDMGETVYPHLVLSSSGSCLLPVGILRACRGDWKLPLQLVVMKDKEVTASRNILILDVSPAIDAMGVIDEAYKTVSNALTDVSEKNGVMTFTRLDGTSSVVNIDDDIAASLASKVDKVTGKELSSNDFTDRLLAKLNGISDVAPVPSDAVPLPASPVGHAGSGTEYSRRDHVHPSDASKADKSALGSLSSLNAGTAEGNVPVLVSGGKLPDSVIPSLAISELAGTVATRSLLAALAAQRGDYAVVTSDPVGSNNGTYLLSGLASEPTAWIQISSPGGGGGGVSSVNGHTGVVTLGAADVSAVPNTRTINAKPLTADVSISKDDIPGLIADLALMGSKADTDKAIWKLSNSKNADGVTWWCTANDGSTSNNRVNNVLKAATPEEQCVLTKSQYEELQSYSLSASITAWDATPPADTDQIAEGYVFSKRIPLSMPHPETLFPIVSVSAASSKVISPQCITDQTGLTIYANANASMTLDRILLVSSISSV